MTATRAQPGDLVLVRTRGRAYAFGRRITGSRYDHVAVAVSGGQSLNIVASLTARRLPLERLLRPALSPLILRPTWRSEESCDEFVAWMEALAERPYDTSRTLQLVPRMVLKRLLGVSVPFSARGAERKRWICTDAVLVGLERYGRGFEGLRDMPLDWAGLRCGTTNDFLVLRDLRPDLLAEVVA